MLTIYRQEVRPFTDKQIALLQNFAAQAVIAMENARLITETREALEQQTATAEVLQVINSSPGDLAPVFDAMLEKAMQLCDAAFGYLMTYDGEYFHAVAHTRRPGRLPNICASAIRPGAGQPACAACWRRTRSCMSPICGREAYRTSRSRAQAMVDLGGCARLLSSPLRKDDALFGVYHRSTARRSARSRTSRSRCYRISRRRRSSRWRTRGC